MGLKMIASMKLVLETDYQIDKLSAKTSGVPPSFSDFTVVYFRSSYHGRRCISSLGFPSRMYNVSSEPIRGTRENMEKINHLLKLVDNICTQHRALPDDPGLCEQSFQSARCSRNAALGSSNEQTSASVFFSMPNGLQDFNHLKSAMEVATTTPNETYKTGNSSLGTFQPLPQPFPLSPPSPSFVIFSSTLPS